MEQFLDEEKLMEKAKRLALKWMNAAYKWSPAKIDTSIRHQEWREKDMFNQLLEGLPEAEIAETIDHVYSGYLLDKTVYSTRLFFKNYQKYRCAIEGRTIDGQQTVSVLKRPTALDVYNKTCSPEWAAAVSGVYSKKDSGAY